MIAILYVDLSKLTSFEFKNHTDKLIANKDECKKELEVFENLTNNLRMIFEIKLNIKFYSYSRKNW